MGLSIHCNAFQIQLEVNLICAPCTWIHSMPSSFSKMWHSRAANKERVENQFLDRWRSVLCIFLCFDSGFEQLACFPQKVCCPSFMATLWQQSGFILKCESWRKSLMGGNISNGRTSMVLIQSNQMNSIMGKRGNGRTFGWRFYEVSRKRRHMLGGSLWSLEKESTGRNHIKWEGWIWGEGRQLESGRRNSMGGIWWEGEIKCREKMLSWDCQTDSVSAH